LHICVFAWEWHQQHHSKRGENTKEYKTHRLKKVFQRTLSRIRVFVKNSLNLTEVEGILGGWLPILYLGAGSPKSPDYGDFSPPIPPLPDVSPLPLINIKINN
jgi:hypothetical protein